MSEADKFEFGHEVWAIVPARGGSKSIPGKNLVSLAGRSLIDYVVHAGQASTSLARIICSTEDARIGAHVRQLGIEVDRRPAELAADDTPVVDVVLDLLHRAGRSCPLPELVVLLQPTSPFVLPEHIDRLIAAMRREPVARSGQTLIPCAHNWHAVNQRRFDDGHVSFVFERERQSAYNKQRKKKHYLFGNLVASRVKYLFETRNVFAPPSIGLEIPRLFGFDLDDADDLVVANGLLSAGVIALPHIKTGKRKGS